MQTTLIVSKPTTRGAVHKGREAKPILVWFPKDIVAAMDCAVLQEDSDRSKFIRRAVRSRLASLANLAQAK